MHEMSVAQQIARAVLRAAKREEAVKVDRINIEIGQLTFLNPEQVIFWLAELFKGTEAEAAEISHKMVPARVRCGKCGYEGPLQVKDDPLFHQALPVFACPKCEKGSLEILEGRDCIVSSIEILQQSDLEESPG
ncbi:Hydrogenase maturation factor HypA [subsurface metagenome]